MTSGRYLAFCRENADLTTRELGEALGYTSGCGVSNWENGRSKLPPTKWGTFAKLTGVDECLLVSRLLRWDYQDIYKCVFRDMPVRKAVTLIRSQRQAQSQASKARWFAIPTHLQQRIHGVGTP